MTASRFTPGVSLLDQVKIQAQVLVPVLRALREQVGNADANALFANALREWQADLHRRIAAEAPGEGWAKWSAMVAAKMPYLEGSTESEWIVRERDHLDFHITKCAYADFFRALGEPELGALLTCESDVHEIDAVGEGVEFTRTQTLMQGGDYCDFRYRMVRAAQGEADR